MLLSSNDELPLISCLLVTAGGRFEYFRQSVACFKAQTYPNRELVIVNEGPKEYQEQIAEHVSDMSNVKLVFLDGFYTVGALRNISMAVCNGDIWVQWDDDDFNMPERLAVQHSFFSRDPDSKVCYLADQLHYYFPTREVYWEDWLAHGSGGAKKWGLIPGTCMSHRGLPIRYPSSGEHASAGEDSVFSNWLVDNMYNEVQLLQGRGYMQVYSFHGKNVWDIKHHTNISKFRSHGIIHMLKNRERIEKTLDYLGFSDEVRVMGREGLAFTYRRKNADIAVRATEN